MATHETTRRVEVDGREEEEVHPANRGGEEVDGREEQEVQPANGDGDELSGTYDEQVRPAKPANNHGRNAERITSKTFSSK